MQLNMDDRGIVRASIAVTLFTSFCVIFCGLSCASEMPQPGNKY
jgi:hypothetical protein